MSPSCRKSLHEEGRYVSGTELENELEETRSSNDPDQKYRLVLRKTARFPLQMISALFYIDASEFLFDIHL